VRLEKAVPDNFEDKRPRALKGKRGSGGEGDNGPFPKWKVIPSEINKDKQGQELPGTGVRELGEVRRCRRGAGSWRGDVFEEFDPATDAIIRFLELRTES